jgi:ankyrin repeat protein
MDEIDRLGLAAETGDLEEVARLVQAGVPVDAKHSTGRARTALDRAIWAEQTEAVRLLLASDADPDQEIGEYGEDMPVRFAAPRGLVDIMGLLLEAGADPDGRVHDKQETPLERAALQGHAALVEMMLKFGASIHYIEGRRGTPLISAAAGGWPVIVQLLLDRGAMPKRAALELAEERSLDHQSDPDRLADYAQVIAMLKAARA